MITTHRHRCVNCGKRFRTPQGLGLHFAHVRKNPKLCPTRKADR